MCRYAGHRIGYVVGTGNDSRTVICRLGYSELSKAPRRGELVVIKSKDSRWLGRVEEEKHVSIDLREEEVRSAIARGQYINVEISEHEKGMYFGHDFTIRLLGELTAGTPVAFRPVVRNLPPRSSEILQLTKEEISVLVMLDQKGALIGYYAVGHEVFDEGHGDIAVQFDVRRFVSRRTAIFGVAGFGKSNLMKNILAYLSVGAPEVGKLIFDLEGEYAFKTQQGKGLADVPAVRENLLVYTNSDRPEYSDVIGGPACINLQQVSPYKAISLLLPESRQERVYADILKSLDMEKWKKVVEYVAAHGLESDINALAQILNLNPDSSGSNGKANPSTLVGMINALAPMLKGHKPESTLFSETYEALRQGATVVVDLSQMSLDAAFKTMLLLVDDIFAKNQEAFVNGGAVPEIIVFVEEAQNLLSKEQVQEGNPVARLAKEGRKYNLGLVYVSQQPSAIAEEILSQTNNFFVMHLLSEPDIKALSRINPHYGGVVAEFVQTESLLGHAYIYSAVPGMPPQSYVFGCKVVNFDTISEWLEKVKPKGYRSYRQRKLEWTEHLAKELDKLLESEPPVKQGFEMDGKKFDVYDWWKISRSLHRNTPSEWPVRQANYPDQVSDEWIKLAFAHLGIPYEGWRWEEEQGKKRPLIYIPCDR